MSHRARVKRERSVPRILFAVVFAACASRAAAAADYPDYAPSPPPTQSDRADRPADRYQPGEAYQPADGYQPAEQQRPNDLRRPADAGMPNELRRPSDLGGPDEPVDGVAGPRPLPVRFQPVEYQAPASAVPAAEAQPSSETKPAPDAQPAADIKPAAEKLADRQPAIPLAPQSPLTRSFFRSPDVPPWLAGAGSLGIVLGLFLMVVWVVRRGMPKNVALLPREAVEVLGRAPLFGREHVYLIRCGNKVLLVCASAGKLETLTEITDPSEVDRLAGICQQINPNSATASFRQVFRQFGQNPAGRDYLARQRADEVDFDELESVGHHPAGESRA